MKRIEVIQKFVASMILILAVLMVNAQDSHYSHAESPADTHVGVVKHHDSHFSKHHIAVFEGIVSNLDHHTNVNSIGLDYEFRPTKYFGFGFAGEHVFSKEGELLLGIPLFIHPVGGLKLAFAPIAINMVHHTQDIGGHSIDTHHADEKEWFFGARLNMAYDIHINNFSIGPSVSYDITETDALIYGLALGVGF